MPRTTAVRTLPRAAVALFAALVLAVATVLLTGAGLTGSDSAGASWHKSNQAGASWHVVTSTETDGASWH